MRRDDETRAREVTAARLGLMLYTVREDCDGDLPATLHAVAEMGYEGVELFGLHGHPAHDVREMLDATGLEPVGRHVSLAMLEEELGTLEGEADVLGTNRVVLSWIEAPATGEAAAALVARLARIGDEARGLGVDLGFHNHDGEVRPLDGGGTFLDRLLETPLFLELDLGWAWWAGADPLALLERTAGRVPLVHVKDFRTRGERSFCPVGDGSVGYDRVAPAAVSAGAEWLLVEQDETDGPALAAARRSLGALEAILERA